MADEPITRNSAFVYAILVDGVVRYIGKGRGSRIRGHLLEAARLNRRRAEGERIRASKFYNRLAKALRESRAVTSELLATGLTDAAAFEREAVEIAARSDGQLWNLLPGGLGGDSAFFRIFWNDPRNRRRASERAKAVWDRDGFRERETQKARQRCGTEEFRAMRSAEMKARFAQENYRAAHGDRMKERWVRDRDKILASQSEGRLAAREKFSLATKAKWQDPAYREKLCRAQQARWTPEARIQRSEKMKAKYAAARAAKG